MTQTRLGAMWLEVDDRLGDRPDLPMLSVTQTRGVVLRSEVTRKAARAESLSSYKLCRPGDLVLNRFNAYRGALGVVTVEGLVSPDYFVARPVGRNHSRFIEYLLRSDEVASFMKQTMGGIGGNDPDTSGFSRINVSALNQHLVTFRERDEQRRIADFLDVETAEIDRLIAKQTSLIDTLRERRAAIGTIMVTRGLGDHQLVDSGDPYLGDVPSTWTITRLRRVMSINSGQVDPREQPWSSMVLVAPNHIESATGRIISRETAAQQGADSGKYLVDSGQLMYSKIRPALNKAAIAVEDCLCSADMYAMSASPDVDHGYALNYMLAKPFHRFASETSMRVKMPKINREELADAPWMIPPIEEQRRIVVAIDEQTSKIDALISKAEQFVELAKERRTALITAAVTGQIDLQAVA